MMEKLDFLKSTVNCVDCTGFLHNVADGKIIYKINELVDAVNELTSCVGQLGVEFTDPTPDKNVQDEYAEQRKWIGRVCKFWNVDKDNATYGILEEVVTNWAYRFKAKDDQYLWDHCEPVKPDDDIIYKGE